MRCFLVLALFAVAAQAGGGGWWRPEPVLCTEKRCYCLPTTVGAAVDCKTCACRACVIPNVDLPFDPCTPVLIEAPFYLNRTANACLDCTATNCSPEGCNEQGQCRKCREGFSREVATGNCVKATLANCDKVSSRDSTKCDECALGFARDLAGQCTVKCIDGCARCRVGSPTVCNACLSGFGRNATATACLPCADKNCARCDVNQAFCQACKPVTDPAAKAFYVANNGTCTEFPLV